MVIGLVAAVAALGRPGPLAAQATLTRAPTPPNNACPGCDTTSEDQDERQLMAARAQLESARQALLDAMQRLAATRDSSGLTAEALTRAQREFRRAEQRYGQVTGDLLKRRLQAAEAEDAAEAAATTATVRAFSAPNDMAPAGWLGVALSAGAHSIEHTGGKAVMRFEAYPTIESVDPDSPAERAGLQAGDKLLALDGRDVTAGCEPLATLLKPGSHVTLRVKRGSYTKQLMAVIGSRPQSDWVWNWRVSPAPPAPPVPSVPPMPEESVPEPDVRVFTGPMPAPLVMGSMRGLSVASDMSFVAGAEVRPVGSLADYFGVRTGVLVLHVVPGSVASRSGLRDGDVIVSAGGLAVTTPGALSRSIYRASDEQQLKLDIVRLKKRRSVLLKWDSQ